MKIPVKIIIEYNKAQIEYIFDIKKKVLIL